MREEKSEMGEKREKEEIEKRRQKSPGQQSVGPGVVWVSGTGTALYDCLFFLYSAIMCRIWRNRGFF